MKFIYASLLLLFASSCSLLRPGRDDGKIDVRFIQVNDVYEIAPLSGGREGGIARVAALKKQVQQKVPNTFLLIAGDFLSPSVFNSLQFEGKAIRGRQMVEALNAAGLDFAVFGNHEFDIREQELQQRINESRFQWIASNTFHKTASGVRPFARNATDTIPRRFILEVKDQDGTKARIGILSVCLPFNKADYVSYTDALTAARAAYEQLVPQTDAVIAITHQSMEEDQELARQLPGLAAIMGGHEHDGRYDRIGKVLITKALANAKSAYVLKLRLRPGKKKWRSEADLQLIDDQLPLDSATNRVVEKWTQIAERNYSSLGFNAGRIVRASGDPLDGRESAVRSAPTNLTRLIISAIAAAAPEADIALFNAGSIRVDDVLPMPITEYDVIRTLPFGGGLREVQMKGSLLIQVLEQGEKNKGIGGYLLHNESLVRQGNNWTLNGTPIEADRSYRVVMSEFLLTGKEANLEFLTSNNAGITKTYPAEAAKGSALSDVRLAIIRFLEKDK